MSQVIAVVSGKGGTGKTSFTTLTGMALAQLGKKTLLLDCDIGLRNLDLYLGVSDRALMDFTDVIAGRTTLAQAVVRHPLYPNLYLLTAPVSFGVRLPSKREMQRLIDEIRRHFDFCLIDAAAGIGEAFALATCCADRAVVVTTNDPSSLRDAQRTVMELHRQPRAAQALTVPPHHDRRRHRRRGSSAARRHSGGRECPCCFGARTFPAPQVSLRRALRLRKHRPPPVRRTRASDAAVAPVHKGKHAFPANIFSKPACPCQPMKVPLQ